MGQGQQKQTSNQNTQQTASNESKFLVYIRDALRNCSNGGYVSKDSFNQVLAVLENLGFKRLRDTPLADRLFAVLDTNQSGNVPVNDITKTINQVISDRNCALMYTFRIYDRDGDNRISKKQFVQTIQDSWRASFRILAQKCDPARGAKLTIRDLQNWAASKIHILNQHSTKLFNRLNTTNSGFIQFPAFKQYINSGYNEIVASINDQKVCIPLNLTTLLAN